MKFFFFDSGLHSSNSLNHHWEFQNLPSLPRWLSLHTPPSRMAAGASVVLNITESLWTLCLLVGQVQS